MTADLLRRKFLRQVGPALGLGILAAGRCSTGSSRARRTTPGDQRLGSRHRDSAGDHSCADGELQNSRGIDRAIKHAGVARSVGFGVSDRNSGASVNDATIFEAASMSKPVFAYFVMKLCERGVLDLDAPLTRYSAEPFLKGDRRLDLITARHVLSHTSGFQDIRSGDNPLAIQFLPGERWQYSGEGYAYLQSVVTALTGHVDQNECSTYEADIKVCGTDFDTNVRANMLEPFGMRSSRYVGNEALSKDMARPHDDQGRPLTPGRKIHLRRCRAVWRDGGAADDVHRLREVHDRGDGSQTGRFISPCQERCRSDAEDLDRA